MLYINISLELIQQKVYGFIFSLQDGRSAELKAEFNEEEKDITNFS